MNRLFVWLSGDPPLGVLTVTKWDEKCYPSVARSRHFQLGVRLIGLIGVVGLDFGLILTIRLYNRLTPPKPFNLMCPLLDTWWQDVTLSR